MRYKGTPTYIQLMSTLVCFLVIVALSMFGSGWPAPANTAYGRTIPSVTPKRDDHGHRKTPEPGGAPTPAAQTPSPTRVHGPGEIPVEPGRGGEGESEGRRCRILITPDDLAEPGTLLVTEVPVDALPKRDKRYSYLRACEVRFRDKDYHIRDLQQSSAAYVFANPISVCFPYTDEDLVRTQNQIARLTILTYDEVGELWGELPIVLSEAERQICGQLAQTGIVALAVKSSDASSLPNTSGNMPDGARAAGGLPQAAPAPSAALAPTAGKPAAGQTAAPTEAAVEPAPVASNPLAAQPIAQAAPAAGSGGLPMLLIIGLLVALSVAAVIVVLSRGFLTRGREGEE